MLQGYEYHKLLAPLRLVLLVTPQAEYGEHKWLMWSCLAFRTLRIADGWLDTLPSDHAILNGSAAYDSSYYLPFSYGITIGIQ